MMIPLEGKAAIKPWCIKTYLSELLLWTLVSIITNWTKTNTILKKKKKKKKIVTWNKR